MNTDFAVEVVEVSSIRPHPNADRLEIAVVKGWQVVVGKGEFTSGDLAVYVPVDAILPEELSDRWGVTKYLSKQRVRAARLRGEMSYGFLVSAKGSDFSLGDDLTELYGVTKYETPIRVTAGDAESPNPRFFHYGRINNYRNFPGIFMEGTPVVVTEKIHGMNCRVGLIDDGGCRELACGSHSVQRRRGTNSVFETPLTIPEVVELLNSPEWDGKNVVLYGELYGRNVQDLEYGLNTVQFIAFDICVDGQFLPFREFDIACRCFGVPTVPVVYRGPFDEETILHLGTGQSILCPEQMREGVVIKAEHEATNPAIGRMVLKVISDDYLLRSGGTEVH